MRWFEQKPKILIIICFIGLYSTFQFRSKISTRKIRRKNRNCRHLKNNWVLQNAEDDDKDNVFFRKVVNLPTEVLLTNVSSEPYMGYNDINLRKQMLTRWIFKRMFPKNTKFIYVEKFRGNGEVRIGGKVVGYFLNEFRSLAIELQYRFKKATYIETVTN